MIGHWLTTGWRSLVVNPLFSIITIASLSIGCCGALLAGANIKQHLSFERGIPHADRILLVRMRDDAAPGSPMAAGNSAVRDGEFSYNMKPALKASIEGRLPGMAAQTRVMSSGSLLADERGEPTSDTARTVDPEFLDVFEFGFVEGSRETAFATPESVVLTETKARELFGKEPAFGKDLRGIQKKIFRVGAVIADPPAPTMFDFDLLGSFATARLLGRANLDSWGLTTTGGHYIRVADGVDRDGFIASVNDYIKSVYSERRGAIVLEASPEAQKRGFPALRPSDFEYRVSLLPITDIHLAPREATGVGSTADITMLATLGAAAAALLAVSAFNYVILSLARAMRRRREIGMRKVLGAGSGDIMRHYLAEAGLVTAISVALGYGFAVLLAPWFARTIGQPEGLFNLYDPVFLAASAGGAALLALFVGAYPALFLAHVRPRAGLDSRENDGASGLGRAITTGLLGLEIAAATVLLAVAFTMAAQAQYVAARPLGFNLANLYAIRAQCPVRATSEFAASNPACSATLDRVVRSTPGIKRIAYSVNPSIFMSGEPSPITRPGGAEKLGDGFRVNVDPDFLPLVGAKLVAGRLFDKTSAYDRRQIDIYPDYPKEPFDSVPVVVTRAILPMVGADAPEAALGKRVMIASQSQWTRSYEIVGVIEDWHQRSLRHSVAPIVFVPGGTMMHAIAEIDENDLPAVQERLSPAGGFAGGNSFDIGGSFLRLDVTSLETAFENAYEADRKLMVAVASFAALAILVAGMGVFGLSAFEMRRRVREIGLRKSLGAAPVHVVAMVVGKSLLFCAVASAVAWPIGYWIANEWLTGYVYRTSLGMAVLPLASVVVLGFTALAVSFSALRAAAIRPSAALRID